MLEMLLSLVCLKKRFIWFNLLATLIMFILLMYVNFISHFIVSNKLLEFGLRGFPLNFYIWVFMLPLQIHLFLFSNKASYWFIYLSMWMTLFSLVTTLAFSMSLSSNLVRLLNQRTLGIFTTFGGFRLQGLLRLCLVRVKPFPKNILFSGNAIFRKGKRFHVFGCHKIHFTEN